MQAMAKQINGTPSNVLANGMKLYINVKSHLLERGGKLLIQDPDGSTKESMTGQWKRSASLESGSCC